VRLLSRSVIGPTGLAAAQNTRKSSWVHSSCGEFLGDPEPELELVAPHDRVARRMAVGSLSCLPTVGEVMNGMFVEALTADPGVGEDVEAEAEFERRFCVTIASG
jgi:hypothetical protein